MNAVNIFEAKTNLSKIISIVEEKKEPYIIIMRSGKPVAKIVPYEERPARKIGLAKDKIPMLLDVEDFNNLDCENDFVGNGCLR